MHLYFYTYIYIQLVIRAMEVKYQEINLVWKVMDIRQMDGLVDNSFDIAIDKVTMESNFQLRVKLAFPLFGPLQ